MVTVIQHIVAETRIPKTTRYRHSMMMPVKILKKRSETAKHMIGRLYDIYDFLLNKEIAHGISGEKAARMMRKKTYHIAAAERNNTLLYERYGIQVSQESFANQWKVVTEKLRRFPEITSKIDIVPEDKKYLEKEIL